MILADPELPIPLAIPGLFRFIQVLHHQQIRIGVAKLTGKSLKSRIFLCRPPLLSLHVYFLSSSKRLSADMLTKNGTERTGLVEQRSRVQREREIVKEKMHREQEELR
jgi:hypothetical protein